MVSAAKKIQNQSTCKALRSIRVSKGVSRSELGQKLGVTSKAIEKYENGRDMLSPERVDKILKALDCSKQQLKKLKQGKYFALGLGREKKVLTNADRRSYKRIITQECRVLRSMRRVKGFTQYEASALCGYSRPTIGHIENGRIELNRERIEHIISCYGYKYSDFEQNLAKEELRDEVIDSCINRIQALDDTKLDIVKNLLRSL